MDLQYYNFTINPLGLSGAAAAKYVADVHEHLRWMHRTTSGRLLLDVIRSPTFPVEIRPYPTAACNSWGGGTRPSATDPYTGLVKYSPFAFSAHGSCANTMPDTEKRGRLWDEILFHELVHVFRIATGRFNKTPALSFNMRQYEDNEEFIAVLCTNIYVSDRTNKIKSGLRAGHQGFGAMSAADAARFGLFTSSANAFSLVQKFCNENPIFTKALSDKLANVAYNPIADYYRYPKVCEAFATLGRFKDMSARIEALTKVGLSPAVAAQIVTMSF